MTAFIVRLKERKLVQWALAYVAFAFALIQVLDIIAQRFGWPDQLDRILILALVIGFAVVLVLAWYHGERGAQKVSGTEIVILALLLAIGGGLLWRFARVSNAGDASMDRSAEAAQRNPGTIVPDSVAGASSPGLRTVSTITSTQAIPIPAKSIAVLPFENLSADKDNAYFASGMQDMILTKLADIGDLKVISRTSTEKFASHPDNLKAIAQQLGVATILEGSVQKSGNQVLINVQLIDAASDNHLWAEAYPRTLENIFGVEGEVAQKVADSLQARLTTTEQHNITAIPTKNPQAYDAFLKAETLAYHADDTEMEADYLAADAAYRQAIALDPGFALAYAQLAYNQTQRHWFARYLSVSELAEVKAEADHALALAPDLPEAHLALGYYYYHGFRRYGEAVTQFQRTLELAPNNLDALKGLAYIDRRAGQFEQALVALRKILSRAPRDRVVLNEYGITFLILRRYPEAVQQMSRALAVDPMFEDGKDYMVRAQLFGFGDVQAAHAILNADSEWRMSALSKNRSGEAFNEINPRAYPDVFARHFDAALHDWDSAPTDTDEERLTQRVARVEIQIIAGRQASIQPECEKLKPLLDAELAKNPESLSALQQASWVDVCLGRNTEAIAAARRAADVLPLSKDAYFGVFQLEGLAEIEARAGAPDDALKLIAQLLAMPAGESMSIVRLKLDPVWDPLRSDPRFKVLLKKYENIRPAAARSGGAA